MLLLIHVANLQRKYSLSLLLFALFDQRKLYSTRISHLVPIHDYLL